MAATPLFAYAQTAQGSAPASGGAPSGAIAGAAGSAAGCAISFGLGGALGLGVGTGISAAQNVIGVPVSNVGITTTAAATSYSAGTDASNSMRDNLMSCLARAVARAMLQQITISTVNWINSGFNGSPSFIQNYQQFFTNVADQAVGSFIQGSDLAFLCSPFRLQVRIAVAQAYLRYTPSCTLTGITNNINSFMNSFSQGGWPAFMSFTTVPMNNPYGAFMYAQAGALTAMSNAQGQKTLDLQLGQGFLSSQKQENCQIVDTPPPSSPNKSVETVASEGGNYYKVCDLVTTTPGTAINKALGDALNVGNQSLIDAKTWDESISAIVTALVNQMLYQGLSSLSNGGSGYQSTYGTTISSLSSQAGQTLAQQVQSAIAPPQQIVAIETQNIYNVKSASAGAQSLYDCWNQAATGTTTLTDLQQAQALQNAAAASTTLQSLASRLASYNHALDLATSSLSALSQFMSLVQTTTDINAVQQLTTQFTAYAVSGQLPGAGDVVIAQQDQALLSGDLATINANTQTSLATCRAFPPPAQGSTFQGG